MKTDKAGKAILIVLTFFFALIVGGVFTVVVMDIPRVKQVNCK